MPRCASYVLHTHDIIDDVTVSKIRSNPKIPTTWSVFFIVQRGTNIVIICGSWDILLMYLSFGFSFGLKIIRGWKSKSFPGISKIHILHMIASISLQIWQLGGKLCKMKPFWPWWHHQWRHNVTLHIALYINARERVVLGMSISKVNILVNNANIVIIFPRYV